MHVNNFLMRKNSVGHLVLPVNVKSLSLVAVLKEVREKIEGVVPFVKGFFLTDS
jgi:hypothetical protein